MWKELKRMTLEAAAETVNDQAEKDVVVKVWGKLVSQVIGEMKNGIAEARQHNISMQATVNGTTRERTTDSSRTWDMGHGILSDMGSTKLKHHRNEPVDVISLDSNCGVYL